MKITINIMIGNYKYVELTLEQASEMLRKLKELFPSKEKDVNEVFRILENFDVFYGIARRKFKNYILIPHETSDMLRGTVMFDKVKLIKEDSEKKVGLVFDRNINVDDIVKILNDLGFETEIIKSRL